MPIPVSGSSSWGSASRPRRPSTALTVLRAKAEGIENFSVFCNHVTVVPAIKAILDSPGMRLDGFLGPGHVSTVIGCRPYEFIASGYGRPLVVSGFEPLDLLASIAMLVEQLRDGRCEIENQYTRVVGWDGNPRALAVIAEVMELRPTFEWRGLGSIPHSALAMRETYAAFDAERIFKLPGVRVADPKSCQCGEVLKGVHQALGVQGVRHRLHPGDPDRDLHGVQRRCLRRVLQLRPVHAAAGSGRRRRDDRGRHADGDRDEDRDRARDEPRGTRTRAHRPRPARASPAAGRPCRTCARGRRPRRRHPGRCRLPRRAAQPGLGSRSRTRPSSP